MKYVTFKANADNYMYLFYNKTYAISVDPVDSEVINIALSKRFSRSHYSSKESIMLEKDCKSRKLIMNLTTHRHNDHSGGNKQLESLQQKTLFLSGFEDKIRRLVLVKDGVSIKTELCEVTSMHTPCHTKDSFCFLLTSKLNNNKKQYLLTGDTIFKFGVGRFFEGTAEEMVKNIESIMKLDDETGLMYGHNYTKLNSIFAGQFIKIPKKIIKKRFLKLKEEKTYNPFFRICIENESYEIKVEEMRKLRNKKDSFKE